MDVGFRFTFGVYVSLGENQEQSRSIKNLELLEFVGDRPG